MNRWKLIGLAAAACLCVPAPAILAAEPFVIVAEAHPGPHRHHGPADERGPGNGPAARPRPEPAAKTRPVVTPAAASKPAPSAPASDERPVVTPADSPAARHRVWGEYAAIFDPVYYYDHYTDLQTSIGRDDAKLLEHFIHYGMAEGRVGCREFNVNVYQANNPDLQAAFGNNLPAYFSHYMGCGCREGRICR